MALSLENITELFRFALLLTCDSAAAGEMLVAAVAETPDELMQLRSEKSRTVWLLRRIRDRAGEKRAAAKLDNEGPKMEQTEMLLVADDVQAFSALQENLTGDHIPLPPSTLHSPSSLLPRIATLPEPERSAFALFFLDLLDLREQAQFFGISIEELSERLGSARKFLWEAEKA